MGFMANPAGAAEGSKPDAVDLHTEAMEAELDGDPKKALVLLRQAFALDTSDPMISFDLVRLLMKAEDEKGAAELDAFLESDPASVDGVLLQAYIHIQRKEPQKARQRVALAVERYPESREAQKLNAQLQPKVRPGTAITARSTETAPRKTKSALAARIRAGAEHDTNVLVLPDALTDGEGAIRTVVDGQLRYSPLKYLTVSGGFNVGPHVTNTDAVSAYDSYSARASLRLSQRWDATDASVTLGGDTIFIGSGFQSFMNAGTLAGEAGLRDGPMRLSFRLSTTLRDFTAQGSIDDATPVPEGEEQGNVSGDRDGTRTEAILGLSYGSRKAYAYLRWGYQGEHTDGVQQTENGMLGTLGGTALLGPVTLGGGVRYELRNYVAKRLGRRDSRLTGYGRVGFRVTEEIAVVAQTSYIENISALDPTEDYLASLRQEDPTAEPADFSYSRIVTSLAVEATW